LSLRASRFSRLVVAVVIIVVVVVAVVAAPIIIIDVVGAAAAVVAVIITIVVAVAIIGIYRFDGVRLMVLGRLWLILNDARWLRFSLAHL